MTGYIVATDVTTTASGANAYTLAAGDTLYVASKALIAAAGGFVSSSGSNGILAGAGVSITVDGAVYSAENAAIRVTGSDAVVDLNGRLSADRLTGILLLGSSSTVRVNASAKVTANSGIFASSLTGTQIVTNAGEIVGTDGIVIYSTGRVINSGSISAASSGITISAYNGGFSSVVNSGLIAGSSSGLVVQGGAGDSTSIKNSGTISSAALAVTTSSASDTLINAGTIIGGVVMGSGADLVDTTAGTIAGAVSLDDGADTFLGSALGDVVFGGEGNDVLRGYGGDDRLNGDAGSDQLFGGDGDDRLTGGAGGDLLTGGAGADTFLFSSDDLGQAADLITDFERGVDKIDISAIGTGAAVAVNLGTSYSTVYYQTASGTGGQGVISLFGTIVAGDIITGAGTTFFITGSVLSETIVGTAGVDYVTGGGGADILTGGAGGDVFVYGSVADSPAGANDTILDFETGADKLDFTALGAGSAIAINMGPWSTVYYQTANSGSQGVIGISGIVRGSDLNVSAGATVYITGTSGSDVIYGSNVVDYISGGAGDDNIAGGLGADVLTGGAGSDAFYVFSVAESAAAAPDRITDLDSSQDYIDLSSIDANTGVAGQQHFTLVAGFTGAAGQLVSYVSGGFIHFDGDVNGDGVADLAVLVTPTAYWDPYADPPHLRL